MVDIGALKTPAERRAGSSPAIGTKEQQECLKPVDHPRRRDPRARRAVGQSRAASNLREGRLITVRALRPIQPATPKGSAMIDQLLDRDSFREGVFIRDRNTCVTCGAPAVDAHHIIERKLYTDGGYYLSNGSSLCARCHLYAEMTVLSVEEIRRSIGIETFVLPECLTAGRSYDKWGNEVLADGRRVPGPLFGDHGARKILLRAGLLYDGTFITTGMP